MGSKPLIALVLMAVLLSGGCLGGGRSRYFCPDGREVSDSELCFATGDMCNSVSSILEKRNRCNLKRVEVNGRVSEPKFRTSARGNNYTIFNLESNEKELRVFVREHPPVQEGDDVMVEGVFHKKKQVGKYSFRNEIEAVVVKIK